MTYSEALKLMEGTSWKGAAPGLGREREILEVLGNPQDKCRFVHVAGTNGKGSTCAMIASVLQKAGYKTGLYTSPHLSRVNERFVIDGSCISDEEFVRLAEKTEAARRKTGNICTGFEMLTAAAFMYFAENSCDIVVLETGLGGRFDATNVISCPEVAVITNISLDHCSVLGNTTEEIAFEKAGIFKGGCCVSHPQTPEAASVLSGAAEFAGPPLKFADMSRVLPLSAAPEGQRFYYGDEEYFIPLLGNYQRENAAAALLTIECLKNNGWEISPEDVTRGLSEVKWPGRFEILMRNPYFIVDGGHNPHSAEAVRDTLLQYFPDKKITLLIGVLSDKDWPAMLDILAPAADGFVAVTPGSARALSAKTLAWALERYGKEVKAREAVEDGVIAALTSAGSDGVVCAFGSLYLAGELRECFKKR